MQNNTDGALIFDGFFKSADQPIFLPIEGDLYNDERNTSEVTNSQVLNCTLGLSHLSAIEITKVRLCEKVRLMEPLPEVSVIAIPQTTKDVEQPVHDTSKVCNKLREMLFDEEFEQTYIIYSTKTQKWGNTVKAPSLQAQPSTSVCIPSLYRLNELLIDENDVPPLNASLESKNCVDERPVSRNSSSSLVVISTDEEYVVISSDEKCETPPLNNLPGPSNNNLAKPINKLTVCRSTTEKHRINSKSAEEHRNPLPCSAKSIPSTSMSFIKTVTPNASNSSNIFRGVPLDDMDNQINCGPSLGISCLALPQPSKPELSKQCREIVKKPEPISRKPTATPAEISKQLPNKKPRSSASCSISSPTLPSSGTGSPLHSKNRSRNRPNKRESIRLEKNVATFAHPAPKIATSSSLGKDSREPIIDLSDLDDTDQDRSSYGDGDSRPDFTRPQIVLSRQSMSFIKTVTQKSERPGNRTPATASIRKPPARGRSARGRGSKRPRPT